MDLNPYESPQTEHPRKRRRLTRQIGLAVTLLLTPVAFAIALLSVCSAGRTMFWFDAKFLFYIPPVVLIGMLLFAAFIRGKRPQDPQQRFASALVATPFVMLLFSIAGYLLAVIAYFVLSERGQGGPSPKNEWIVFVAFWIPPFLALADMLRRAWEVR